MELLSGPNEVLKILNDRLDYEIHPFLIQESDVTTKFKVAECLEMQANLVYYFKGKGNNSNVTWPFNEVMFEACVIPPTNA
jgi:hypothetical protein